MVVGFGLKHRQIHIDNTEIHRDNTLAKTVLQLNFLIWLKTCKSWCLPELSKITQLHQIIYWSELFGFLRAICIVDFVIVASLCVFNIQRFSVSSYIYDQYFLKQCL